MASRKRTSLGANLPLDDFANVSSQPSPYSEPVLADFLRKSPRAFGALAPWRCSRAAINERSRRRERANGRFNVRDVVFGRILRLDGNITRHLFEDFGHARSRSPPTSNERPTRASRFIFRDEANSRRRKRAEISTRNCHRVRRIERIARSNVAAKACRRDVRTRQKKKKQNHLKSVRRTTELRARTTTMVKDRKKNRSSIRAVFHEIRSISLRRRQKTLERRKRRIRRERRGKIEENRDIPKGIRVNRLKVFLPQL